METLLTGTKFVIPLVALGAASLFFFGGCRHHEGGFHGSCGHDPQRLEEVAREHLDEALDELDATDDQRAQVTALADRLLPQIRELVGEHRRVHEELRTAWSQETLDPAPLHALVDSRSEAFTRFAHEVVDAAAELHEVLTPEQRARLAERWERNHRR